MSALLRAKLGAGSASVPSHGAALSEPMVSCSVMLVENDRWMLIENRPRSILMVTLTWTFADTSSGILR